jgi:hypothetical protein
MQSQTDLQADLHKNAKKSHAADHDVQKSVSNARKHFAQLCPCQILLTQTAKKLAASAQMPSYVNGQHPEEIKFAHSEGTKPLLHILSESHYPVGGGGGLKGAVSRFFDFRFFS